MWVLFLAVAYLIGTFPSARLVATANGIDIRSVGSGNPGASNVARVLGWRRGVSVFALDAAKGTIAGGLGLVIEGRPLAYAMIAAAVIGHVFPIWQRFQGGKGVATGGGGFAVVAPIAFFALIPIWYLISRVSKKASLASLVVVILLPIGIGIETGHWWEVFAAVGICLLIMSRHLGNIQRLVTRREHALN